MRTQRIYQHGKKPVFKATKAHKQGTVTAPKAQIPRTNRAQTESKAQGEQAKAESGRARKPREKPENERPQTPKPEKTPAESAKRPAPEPTWLDDPHARANKRLKNPGRARYWEKVFFDVLSKTANITVSARAAGIDRTTIYDRRDRNQKFAAKLKGCIEEAVDLLEMSAWSRAVQGVEKGVWSKDKEGNPVRVETVHEYSDRLHEVLLRGWRPERYSPKIQQEISGPGGQPFSPVVAPTTVIFNIPDNGRGLPAHELSKPVDISAQIKALSEPAKPVIDQPAQPEPATEPEPMTPAQPEDPLDTHNREAMQRIVEQGRANEGDAKPGYRFNGKLNSPLR